MAQTIKLKPEPRLSLTGTLLVLAMAAGFTAALGLYSGLLMPVIYIATSSALLALAVKIHGSEWRPSVRIPLGSIISGISGAVLLYSLGNGLKQIVETLGGFNSIMEVAIQSLGYTGILLSSIPISFGVTYSLLESADKSRVSRSMTSTTYSAAGLVTAAVLIWASTKITRGTLLEGVRQAMESARGTLMSNSMAGTAVLLILSYISLRIAWSSLPISNLVPEKQVETYRKLSGVESKIILPLTILISAGMVVLESIGVPEAAPQILNTIIPVLSSQGIKSVLTGTLIISLGLLALSKTLLKLFRGRGSLSKRITPYIVFSGLVAASSPFLYRRYYENVFQQLTGFPLISGFVQGVQASTFSAAAPQIIAAAAFILVPSIVLTFGTAFLAAAKLIPPRESGNALLSSGIFAAGLASSIAGMNAIFLFGSVALSIASWNIGRTSTRIVEEIGASSATPGPEILRAFTTLGIAAASLGAAYHLALNLALPQVSVNRVAASVLAMLGVILSVTVIRSMEKRKEEGEYTVNPYEAEGQDKEDLDEFVDSHPNEVDEIIEEGN